LYLIIFTWSFK